MKRFICILLTMTIGLFTLVGCGGKDKDITIDISALAGDLTSKIEFQDDLTKIEGNSIESIYQIDYAVSSEVYVSSGATAEEVAVFELKDETEADNAYKAAGERIDAQKQAFESYVPEEMEKLDNAVVKKVGKYVIVCVANDNTAEDIIGTYTD
ncbi:DUF4358 domain-containing protein [Vallitalea guaymasensis]|uniref:DUF4358 domain-containing protein n=1 Tax=Vallitalea guaymasensis TaxID=1185412 RepID=A0A8J8MCS3_9FIRM|nr:DUF4358 domain-containing protein [Vallitalea guaymasensis]QUH30571.1 DUF4358 domain-containing protein [Vallitalea guaymasensis]